MARIVGSCRAAVILASARRLANRIHIFNEWRCRSFVEPIEKVKAFGDQLQFQPFVKVDRTCKAKIERSKPVSKAAIASKITDRELTVCDERRDAALSAGNAKRAVRIYARAVRLRSLVVVRIGIGNDVERPA